MINHWDMVVLSTDLMGFDGSWAISWTFMTGSKHRPTLIMTAFLFIKYQGCHQWMDPMKLEIHGGFHSPKNGWFMSWQIPLKMMIISYSYGFPLGVQCRFVSLLDRIWYMSGKPRKSASTRQIWINQLLTEMDIQVHTARTWHDKVIIGHTKVTRFLMITNNCSIKKQWHELVEGTSSPFYCFPLHAHTHASASAGFHANTPIEHSNLCKSHILLIQKQELGRFPHQIIPKFSSSQPAIMFASDSFSCETHSGYWGSPAPWKPPATHDTTHLGFSALRKVENTHSGEYGTHSISVCSIHQWSYWFTIILGKQIIFRWPELRQILGWFPL